MNSDNSIVLALLGVIAVMGGAWAVRHFFSAEARLERRRRRSNARVSSTVNRPMVKFSVRTKKDRRS
jgi:hypothetical protein